MTNPIKSVRAVGSSTKITIRTPSSYVYKLEDVSQSDAGRTEDTVMHKKRIGQVIGLELEWNYIDSATVSALLKAFNPQYLMVEYWDAKDNQFREAEFYVGNRTAPMYSAVLDIWQNLKFNLIKRSGR